MSHSYINRELSWLEFNQRVLSEAQRNDLPLLERVKFLAITTSNLDEFFQVRVGGLTLMQSTNTRTRDLVGMTPTQQLMAIRQRVTKLLTDAYSLWNQTLLPQLESHHILLRHPDELTSSQVNELSERFLQKIFPLLTPLAYDDDQDPESATHLPAMRLIVAVQLKDETSIERTVFIPIPDILGRFIHLNSPTNRCIVRIEDLIAHQADKLFPEESVLSTACFRITRNGDIAVQEEDAIDLAGEMEDILAARKTSNTVRLELQQGANRKLSTTIRKATSASLSQIYKIDGPLALQDLMEIAFLSGHDDLREPVWTPQHSPLISRQGSIFDDIARQDILLFHPYHSFEPVLKLIEEAAIDPDVLSIKQVLYRTAKNSRVVDALIRAAENGKQVTVLIELKARFDEARNLQRADELKRAGVQIVYGVKGLKTHAKITLVMRNEAGILKRYAHFGTGNYNESTAKLYTDASLLTSRDDYGADASLFFNAVTGRSKLVKFNRLVPAPTHMKRRLLDLIASETARAKLGEEASITAKTNSLQDKEIIDALYAASRAGVKIRLNIRGICCLKTGDSKDCSNISVVSVIDRYLEHARIFHFHQGGDELIFIASADWMTRNLDKRVELMIPIIDNKAKSFLKNVLEAAFKDNQQAHLMLADGSYQRISNPKAKPFRMQSALQADAVSLSKAKTQRRSSTFEPHLPQSDKS